ncbi:hypothetical protein [Streptomyces sp. NPDC046805]|uniref:hypothetical protein n=1 Tax=Streptomyces sp. NPDC046805 TaxID=3155134 RepID=UPI0033F11433
MLRIIDARTGEPVPVPPARRGLTRVEAHVSGPDTSSLRVLLVADLLVRALELGGTPVWSTLTGDREPAELRAAALALGIRPFEDARDLAGGPGEAQTVRVMGEGDDSVPPGTVMRVAPVAGEAGAGVSPASVGGSLPDPAALRLALLSAPRTSPVRIDAAALDDAASTLAQWRRAVAAWARQPSRPVPDDVRRRLHGAWEDDLDVPAVLGVLRWVENSADLPDGARFETYAYADRLLGLELTRDLGSPA